MKEAAMSALIEIDYRRAMSAKTGYRGSRLVQHALLAAAVTSGLTGALQMRPPTVIEVFLPIVFALAHAGSFLSLFGRPSPPASIVRDWGNLRQSSRVAARHVYLLLYGLFAARELEHGFFSPQGGLASREVMHGLWPCLIGGIASLVLSRFLAWRRVLSVSGRPGGRQIMKAFQMTPDQYGQFPVRPSALAMRELLTGPRN